ncbi:hypothetical protein C942_03318 [Photobacterium marinum]|uniref:Uncharacterized protein n=1 Tax=Photobacterium marinum TaxID=1056511 RepID=L8J7V5_9GAMM|nr:hypothetical protein C942_03318 [Photobacterium marinum]
MAFFLSHKIIKNITNDNFSLLQTDVNLTHINISTLPE